MRVAPLCITPFMVSMSLLTEPGPPLVIGHRGAAAVRPENTLASFEFALGLGVDAVEFDVRVSGDGVAVVHHDQFTGRHPVHSQQQPAAKLLLYGVVSVAHGRLCHLRH